MNIKVLSSSSTANTYILESETSQLIVELGCKWSDIIQSLRFDKKISGCIVSHGTADSKELLEHLDHSRSQFDAIKSGVDVFGKHNLKHNQQKKLGEWVILPIELPHGDTTSFNFIIYNKTERKHIFFATDCERLPLIAERKWDCMLLECNYSISQVIENADKLSNKGFNSHLSQEYLISWLERRQHKPKKLVLIHLSGSGNLALDGLVERFSPFAEKCVIAKKNLSIEI